MCAEKTRAGAAGCFCGDVTFVQMDLCAKLLKATDMKVDRTVADGTAAWHGNFGVTTFREQWAEGTNACTHGADDVVMSDGKGGVCDMEIEINAEPVFGGT